ncbi:MAG: glucose-6-phosphate isomerase [Candidatus Melainabacteria bacterium]|nr:glucose-6-phosphate isomerase [Candidatus Melainabacteria bacterium]
MNRQRIRIDLTNYFNIESGANFKSCQDKVFNIIANLYSSKSDPQAMAGWLNLPCDLKMFEEINNFVQGILSSERYEHLLVLGIGGSSLGAQAIIEGLNTPLWNRLSKGKRKEFLTVDFIDNLDPVIIRTILSRLKLNKTLFVVASKGGSTVETIIPMLVIKKWLQEEACDFYKQCVFVTTENKGLLFDIGKRNSVTMFFIPENIGGRYSVFSPVGLLPIALCGVDINEIRAGILEADNLCKLQDLKLNLAASIALCAYFSYVANKTIFVLMPYSTCLKRFVDWFIQLWAESLGKSRRGSTPLGAIGATDQHSQIQMFNEGQNDKLVCFVKINKHKRDLTIPDFSSESQEFKLYADHKIGEVLNIELDATRRALTENERPNFTITLPELDEYYLAKLMYIFEVATAATGNLLGVNPFNQPGVELAKKYTREALNLTLCSNN